MISIDAFNAICLSFAETTAKLKTENTSLKKELAELNNNRLTEMKEVADRTDNHTWVIADLKKQLAEKEKEIDEKDSELAEKQDELDEKLDELDEKQDELIETEQKVFELAGQIEIMNERCRCRNDSSVEVK